MCRAGSNDHPGRRCPNEAKRSKDPKWREDRNTRRRAAYADRKLEERAVQHNKPWDISHPTHDPRTRTLPIPKSCNIRTLAGIPTLDGGTIAENRVMRGEAPHLLGEEGVQALLDQGVRHFVDLRAQKEIDECGNGALQKYIDDGTVTVHRVKMTLSPEFLEANPGYDPYADLGYTYKAVLDGTGPELVTVLDNAFTQADLDNSPLHIHCAAGKDRTGFIAAALLDLGGADPRAISDDYLATASSFGRIVEQLKTTESYRKDFVDAPPERYTPSRPVIDRFIDLVEAEGGCESLLVGYGANREMVSRWRALMRTDNVPAHAEGDAAA